MKKAVIYVRGNNKEMQEIFDNFFTYLMNFFLFYKKNRILLLLL